MKKYPSIFEICLCNLASIATGICTLCIIKYLNVQMAGEDATAVLVRLILLFILEFVYICTMLLHLYKKARDMIARIILMLLGGLLVICEQKIGILAVCSVIVFAITCLMNFKDKEYAKRAF